MDIAELKQQARAQEQQANLGQALETYRQILSEIEAIGGIRQELPVLIKIGDLYLKIGDVDQAVDSYERAAGEYAAQGAAQPVMSLCTKIIRADPQAVGAYLRLARRLLDSGFPDGAREVLIDYAQRGKLDKTREGLERLAGRADDEVKRVLARAIDVAEERIPRRTPRPKAPPPLPQPPPQPVAQEPVTLEPAGPTKRLTVPVGALDAELDPNLLEMRPPEPRPAEPSAPSPPPEVVPQQAFPTAEDLQAPLLPEAPPPRAGPVAPPPPPPTPAPPRLDVEATIAPPMDGMLPTMPPPAAPPSAEPPPPPRLSVPLMEAVVEPPLVSRSADAWGEERTRPSRPSHAIPEEPHPPSRPHPRPSRASVRMAAPARPSRASWFWRVLGLMVVVGGVVGVLVWRQVIPLDRLRTLLRQAEQKVATAPPAQPAAQPPAARRPDTVMARDTATMGAPTTANPTPPPPPAAERPRRPVRPTLPPGVSLTRSVMLVSGLRVESVSPIEAAGKTGFSIVQVLSTGQRLILEEFPADTVGAGGEIGLTGIPPDTVVGHVRMADLEIVMKAAGISEDRMVQFLQDLVQVKP